MYLLKIHLKWLAIKGERHRTLVKEMCPACKIWYGASVHLSCQPACQSPRKRIYIDRICKRTQGFYIGYRWTKRVRASVEHAMESEIRL